MNWHEVMDERNYEMHQVIASVLRTDPAKLQLVVSWIEKFLNDAHYSIQSKDALARGLGVIRRGGVDEVLDLVGERGQEATRMRQSSPFAVLMLQDKRLEILRRYESRRPRAHPASR